MTHSDSRFLLGTTESVCPECLETVPAIRYAEGDTVYLEKTCPVHGSVATPIWRGLKSYLLWDKSPRNHAGVPYPATAVDKGCPQDCGLCGNHLQQSCCVLLEVTSRCNLSCPVCFASATRTGEDMPIATIEAWLDTLMERAGGRVHIQLSGGEPTTRDDLPAIVALARKKGFSFVQLNTNGLRLSHDPTYLAALVKAGLDCVFLQFDGVSDTVHQALRGACLREAKERAIEACSQAGVGVVLVPTLVPGINIDEIGAIVEFAKAHMPVVRAVHFQPISYIGRFPAPPRPETRFTLPEVIGALIAHEGGAISLSDFHPGSAENPFCSFSGRFQVKADGHLIADRTAPAPCCGTPAPILDPAPAPKDRSSCCSSAPEADRATAPSAAVARARRYVADQWTRADPSNPGDPNLAAFDAILDRRARTLGLSAMVFQDAWTLDLERLRQCHIHVMAPDQRAIPFCAYNLTSRQGETLHRRPAP
jgi:uncharacterized radical SAM superfamily Fe-S cluster-containing enzyme